MNDGKDCTPKPDQGSDDAGYRRENYCKYPFVRLGLIADLEAGIPAKDSAKRLGISLPTYYKYKGLVCIQLGKVFTVPEEKAFLERHMAPSKKTTLTPTKPVPIKAVEKKP